MDNLLVSCVDKKANDNFHEWCNEKYGGIKKVKCHRGKVHTFLGMTLDFGREKGAVHVLQEEYIDDLVECLNEKLTGNSPSPATSNLLKKGAGGLLTLEKKELFHTIIAKTFY